MSIRMNVPKLKKANRRATEEDLVAVRFLAKTANAGKTHALEKNDLTHPPRGQFIAAPRLWCPNPEHTVALRVSGESMEPTLFDGYIIVVDQGQTKKANLNKKVIVARHDDFGLVVSRFWQFQQTQALVSDNREHDPVPWSPAWSIVGKVLWWIGGPADEQSLL
jgi:phage repressor protein C with HTH and peptisase S24 domain